MSSEALFRICISAHGSSATQSLLFAAVKESFSVLCIRSTMPFDCGCAVVENLSCMLNFLQNAPHSPEVNVEPLSVVIVVGSPNSEIHPFTNWKSVDFAEADLIDSAIGMRVYRSMIVNAYL